MISSLLKLIEFIKIRVEPRLYAKRVQDRLILQGSKKYNSSDFISLELSSPMCKDDDCNGFFHPYGDYYKKFAASPENLYDSNFSSLILHAISLYEYSNYGEYLKNLKLKKNFIYRNINLALKKGFYIKIFQDFEYQDDRVAIYRSMKFRSFGPVIKAFFWKKNFLSSTGTQTNHINGNQCPFHWDRLIGVFAVNITHESSNKEGGEKLVAFARLHRVGNIVSYKECIGHGLYLEDGAMKLLHSGVMKWLLDSEDPALSGVQYLVHGSVQRGGKGFFYWKKSVLFKPFFIHEIKI